MSQKYEKRMRTKGVFRLIQKQPGADSSAKPADKRKEYAKRRTGDRKS